MAICRWMSPWPHSTISWVSAFCSSRASGPPRSAWRWRRVSLTSSLRFSACDGQAEDRLRRWRAAAVLAPCPTGQHRAGGDLLHARQRHHLAGAAPRQPSRAWRPEPRNTPATRTPLRSMPSLDLAAPDARQRQLAGMGQVIGLDHLRHAARRTRRCRAAPRGVRPRRLVAQRLPQPAHAVILQSGAEKHRHDQVAAPILPQLPVDLVLRGLHILEQLLQQLVVEIGELFDQPGARLALLAQKPVGQLDQVGGLAGLVFIGPLADQIDIAGRSGVRRRAAAPGAAPAAARNTDCSAASTSRTRAPAVSSLLMNIMCGMLWSSRNLQQRATVTRARLPARRPRRRRRRRASRSARPRPARPSRGNRGRSSGRRETSPRRR